MAKKCLFDIIGAIFCRNSDDVMFFEIIKLLAVATPLQEESSNLKKKASCRGHFRNNYQKVGISVLKGKMSMYNVKTEL